VVRVRAARLEAHLLWPFISRVRRRHRQPESE